MRFGERRAAFAVVAAWTLACAPDDGILGGLPPATEGGVADVARDGFSADAGAPLDAGAEASVGDGGSAAMCEGGATRCAGNGVETCGGGGQWSAAAACSWPTPACAGGVCVGPQSCAVSAMGTSNCGASSESCCTSIEVPSGVYDRTYSFGDAGATSLADPASVSAFRLDKYLVTVGRFRQFVSYVTGTSGAQPADGSGIQAQLNGGRGLSNSADPGTFETGWDAGGGLRTS